MTPDAASPPPRRRNGLGIGALVLALVITITPAIVWIAVAIGGAVGETRADDAVYVGVIGGFIVFTGVIGLLAPLALVAAVLGIVSLFRPGSRAPGIAAIVLGAIGSLGLLWLPYVLAELVPGS